jgi:cell division septation protein DedD
MATNESEKEMPASNFQWPEYSKSSAPTPRQRCYFSRGQLVTVGLSFVITASAAGFSGFIAGRKIVESRQTARQLASAPRTVPVSSNQVASTTTARAFDDAANAVLVQSQQLSESAAKIPPPQVVAATVKDGRAATGKIKTSLHLTSDKLTPENDFPAKPAAATAVKTDLAASPWSVQISATQDQTAAQLLQEKLKSKGFDAYVVEAEINSSRWYRVRVGHFNSNQEAEKTRQDLQAKENLVNAFVTGK